MIRLKTASFASAVFFNGQSRMQIVAAYGDSLALEDKYIVAAQNPAKKKDPICIPLSNVTSFVILTAAEAEAEELKVMEAEEKAKTAVKPKPPFQPQPAKVGVLKFEKNQRGEIVEVQK